MACTLTQTENLYSAALLRPLRRRASELFRCMIDRQPEEEGGDNRSVPERVGSYLYYTRRDDGKGFPVYVRRPVEGTVDDEQVVRGSEEGVGGENCFFMFMLHVSALRRDRLGSP